jgi:hypothetical protein
MAGPKDEKIEKKLDEHTSEIKQDSELSEADCEKVAGGGIVIEDKPVPLQVISPKCIINTVIKQS